MQEFVIDCRGEQFWFGSLTADEGVVAMCDDCVLYAVALGDLGGLLSHVLKLVLEVTHNNHRLPIQHTTSSHHLTSIIDHPYASIPAFLADPPYPYDEDGESARCIIIENG